MHSETRGLDEGAVTPGDACDRIVRGTGSGTRAHYEWIHREAARPGRIAIKRQHQFQNHHHLPYGWWVWVANPPPAPFPRLPPLPFPLPHPHLAPNFYAQNHPVFTTPQEQEQQQAVAFDASFAETDARATEQDLAIAFRREFDEIERRLADARGAGDRALSKSPVRGRGKVLLLHP